MMTEGETNNQPNIIAEPRCNPKGNINIASELIHGAAYFVDYAS